MRRPAIPIRRTCPEEARPPSRVLPVSVFLVVLTTGACQDEGQVVVAEPSPAGSPDHVVLTPQPEPEPVPVFPSADTTGVPEGVRLSPSESVTVTEDGAVLDGLHVRGRIVVEADDVVIRNTLVESDTSLAPLHVARDTTGTLIEDVEVDNQGGTGIGIFLQGSATVSRVDVHSAEDGIRINADDVLVEDSYIHDLSRLPDGHHDCIQIRSGDAVTIRGNSLQAYVAAEDDPMNAAVQIGSLSGEDQISELQVVANLMNGGNYTVNGGGRDEVESARYAENRFGRDFRFGVVGNLQNSVWEDSNVWHDTGEPVQ